MKVLDNRGFSLLEMLVAVTILAVGLLAVAGLQATAIKGNFHGGSTSRATALAEDRIEELRNTDYDAISYAPNPFVETNLEKIYTRETFIAPLSDLKRITVTVRWGTARQHQVVLRTIVANGG